MNILRRLTATLLGRTVLASSVLGGFLLFAGAGTASARPVCYHARTRVMIVHPGFYGPRVVYYYRPAPVYRVYPRPVVRRYWDERFHCWRYYR